MSNITNDIRERTIFRSVSYRNQYWVYRIELFWLLFYRGKPDIMCHTADLAAVNRSHYTGDQRTFAPVTRHTCAPFDPRYGRWLGGAGGGKL